MKEEILSSVQSGKVTFSNSHRVLEFVKIFLPEWLDDAANSQSKDIILRLVSDYDNLDTFLKEKGLTPFLYLSPKDKDTFEPKNGFSKPVALFGNTKKTLNDLKLSDEEEFDTVYSAIEKIFKDERLMSEQRSAYGNRVRSTRPRLDTDTMYGYYIVEFDKSYKHSYFAISFSVQIRSSSEQ